MVKLEQFHSKTQAVTRWASESLRLFWKRRSLFLGDVLDRLIQSDDENIWNHQTHAIKSIWEASPLLDSESRQSCRSGWNPGKAQKKAQEKAYHCHLLALHWTPRINSKNFELLRGSNSCQELRSPLTGWPSPADTPKSSPNSFSDV